MELSAERTKLVNHLKDVGAALAVWANRTLWAVPPSRSVGGQPCLEAIWARPKSPMGEGPKRCTARSDGLNASEASDPNSRKERIDADARRAS